MSADFDTWGTDSPRRMREALARIIELVDDCKPAALGADMWAQSTLDTIREEAVQALQVSAGGGK